MFENFEISNTFNITGLKKYNGYNYSESVIVGGKYGFSKYNICHWNKLNKVGTSSLFVGIKKLNFNIKWSYSDFIKIKFKFYYEQGLSQKYLFISIHNKENPTRN